MSSVARPAIERPAKAISPLARIMPHSARRVVVLPAPLAPSRQRHAALGEAEVEAVQRLHGAVIGAQPAHLEQSRRHRLPPPR